MSFDQVVLSFEELHDVIGRLNKRFEPRRYLRYFVSMDSALMGCAPPSDYPPMAGA